MKSSTKKRFNPLLKNKIKRKKTMKGGVICEKIKLFTWKANSCYLDTILIGWLHFAEVDLLQKFQLMESSEEDENKKSLYNILIELISHLSNFANPAFQRKNPTPLREEFRNTLQKCDDFTDRMAIPNLKHTQDSVEIFTQLSEFLKINDIIIQNKYIPFRGYSKNEINSLIAANPERRRNQINTEEQGALRPPQPQRPGDIEYTNIVLLKPIIGLISPQELINTKFEHTRNDKNGHWYLKDKEIYGTVHGILPIGVDRASVTGDVNKRINLEENIQLKDGIYTLVSVICYVPGHYVGYYRCNSGNDWIFYNDLNTPTYRLMGGGIETWEGKNIPGYRDRFPRRSATLLFYKKTEDSENIQQERANANLAKLLEEQEHLNQEERIKQIEENKKYANSLKNKL
jgi:hypothetical protein